MKKYSLIIPTLNEEKLLPELLDELQLQELREKYNYEIIISDGGSSDGTLSIAEKRADKVVIHDNPDRRQTIAEGRNKGAEAAEGDILIFFDSDISLSDPVHFFDYVNSRFDTSKFLAMTCRVYPFKEEMKLSDKIFHGFYNNYFRLINFLGLGMGRGECQIVPRETFELVGGYNEELAAGEDFELYKRIRKHGRIFFANDLAVYESPRRYRKYGYWRITAQWLKNSVSIMLKKKAHSKEWEQVR